MEDLSFTYIGEEEHAENEGFDTEDDNTDRIVRFNKNGQRIRGKDLVWKRKAHFNSPQALRDSKN